MYTTFIVELISHGAVIFSYQPSHGRQWDDGGECGEDDGGFLYFKTSIFDSYVYSYIYMAMLVENTHYHHAHMYQALCLLGAIWPSLWSSTTTSYILFSNRDDARYIYRGWPHRIRNKLSNHCPVVRASSVWLVASGFPRSQIHE